LRVVLVSQNQPTAIYDFIHERLHHALTRARACQLVEEELPTLIALAELHHATAVATVTRPWAEGASGLESNSASPRSGERGYGDRGEERLVEAKRLLDDVWDRAERGPYPLFHADAFNMLAQIERTTAALASPDSAAAREALSRARDAALRAYELAWLQGPPFDEAQYDPMPDVPIVPPSSF
jgi:hypothetical protein